MNVRSLATVVSGASRRGAGPLSTRTYVPHNSYPSIMSRASDSRFAICKKQNSGVLIKKPSPASTNDLSGRTEQKLLSTAGVLVRTSTLPTSVRRGRVHPAGRRFPSERVGRSLEVSARRARLVAACRAS